MLAYYGQVKIFEQKKFYKICAEFQRCLNLLRNCCFSENDGKLNSILDPLHSAKVPLFWQCFLARCVMWLVLIILLLGGRS